MAQFRGTLQGQRGQASRLGSAKTGLNVTGNGWNVGVSIDLKATKDGDFVEVWATGGSNGGHGPTCIARLYETKDGVKVRVMAPAKATISNDEWVKGLEFSI